VVVYVVSLLVAPFSVGPQIVRALTVRGEIEYSRLVIEDEISTRAERNRGCTAPLSTINSAVDSDESGQGKLSSPHQMSKMMEANLIKERTRKMVEMTKWALFVMPAVLLILSLALSSDATQLLATDFGLCQPEPLYFQYISPAFGIASTALALLVTLIVKKIEDELGLGREIQRNATLVGFTYIVIILLRFTGGHDWQPLLQTVQQMLLSFSMAIIPFHPEAAIVSWAKKQGNRINPATKSAVPGYARSLPNHRGSTRLSIQNAIGRRQSILTATQNDQINREVTESWDAGLCILLSTEDGINSFSIHCAREFSSENVRFWCAINDYRAKFDEEICVPTSTEVDDEKSAPVSTTNDKNIDTKAVADKIYTEYISHHAKTQINVSSKQKTEIKNILATGEAKKDLFDAAQREIFSVMSRDSYPRFLASKKNRLQT